MLKKITRKISNMTPKKKDINEKHKEKIKLTKK